MTVEAFTPAPDTVIDGVGPYPIPHPYQHWSELVFSATQGDETVTLTGTDGTVAPLRAPSGVGAVTLSAPAAAAYDGWTLTIRRATAAEQGWLGLTSREKGLERALDRIVHVLQDHGLRISSFETLSVDVAAAIDAAARAEAAVELLDPVWQFLTLAVLRAHDFDGSPPNAVRVLGHAAAGDGGATIYQRKGAPSAHGVYETSADGVVWEVAPAAAYDVRIWGGGLGLSLNTVAFEKGVAISAAQGGELVLPATFTLFETDPVIANKTGFTVRGDGQVIDKLAAGGGAALAITDCSNFMLRDFEIDCRRRSIGDAGHGVRMNRCSDAFLNAIGIRNWTNSGIIAMDSTQATEDGDPFGGAVTYFSNIIVTNCVLDGWGDANNGILFSFVKDGTQHGNTVNNLGRSGAPCFAHQLKANNVNCRISNWTAVNARAGAAIGATGALSSNCRIDNGIAIGCTRALRMANCVYCTANGLTIDMADAADMSGEGAIENAVYLRFADSCQVTGLNIRNYSYAGRHPVWIGQSAESYVEIDNWRNVPFHDKFVHWDTAAAGCVVRLKNYIGTRPAYWGDMMTYTSASANRTIIDEGAHSQRHTIAAGAITILDHGVELIELDTEGAAASDDLVTINGGYDGMPLLICTAHDARDVVVKAAGGNIVPTGGADRTLGLRSDMMALVKRGSATSGLNKWAES